MAGKAERFPDQRLGVGAFTDTIGKLTVSGGAITGAGALTVNTTDSFDLQSGSVAVNLLGTAAAWITLTLSASEKPDPARMAIVGACVAGAYVLIGALLTQFLPEPKEESEEGAR